MRVRERILPAVPTTRLLGAGYAELYTRAVLSELPGLGIGTALLDVVDTRPCSSPKQHTKPAANSAQPGAGSTSFELIRTEDPERADREAVSVLKGDRLILS